MNSLDMRNRPIRSSHNPSSAAHHSSKEVYGLYSLVPTLQNFLLKPDLTLGVPFQQSLHFPPFDFSERFVFFQH